jgi:hypothetical protein
MDRLDPVGASGLANLHRIPLAIWRPKTPRFTPRSTTGEAEVSLSATYVWLSTEQIFMAAAGHWTAAVVGNCRPQATPAPGSVP